MAGEVNVTIVGNLAEIQSFATPRTESQLFRFALDQLLAPSTVKPTSG